MRDPGNALSNRYCPGVDANRRTLSVDWNWRSDADGSSVRKIQETFGLRTDFRGGWFGLVVPWPRWLGVFLAASRVVLLAANEQTVTVLLAIPFGLSVTAAESTSPTSAPE